MFDGDSIIYNSNMDTPEDKWMDGMTYKEIKSMLVENQYETADPNFKIKELTKDLELAQAMCSYIATGYATFVIATEEKNAVGIEDVMVLRDNIIHEARETMEK